MTANSPSDPIGTFRCDVCGVDTPHAHTLWEVEQERHARPAFEEFMAHHTTDSDNIKVVIKPSREIGPYSMYSWPEHNLRWRFYSAGWYDLWRRTNGS